MTKIIGWAYHAEHYTNAGIISEMAAEGIVHKDTPVESVEQALAVWKLLKGVQFPETDDSEHFPQPVFADQIEAWDDQAIDRVNPGDAPDYKMWGEVY